MNVEFVFALIGGIVLFALAVLCVLLSCHRLRKHVYFIGRFSAKGESLVFPATLYIFRLRILMFGSKGYNGVQWQEAGIDPPIYRTLAGFYK